MTQTVRPAHRTLSARGPADGARRYRQARHPYGDGLVAASVSITARPATARADDSPSRFDPVRAANHQTTSPVLGLLIRAVSETFMKDFLLCLALALLWVVAGTIDFYWQP